MSTPYPSDPDTCMNCWGIIPRQGVTYVPDDGTLCSCTDQEGGDSVTENVPQSSASDRYEMARKALRYYDRSDLFAADPKGHTRRSLSRVSAALRALITPSNIGIPELVKDFRDRIVEQGSIAVLGQRVAYDQTAHAQTVEGYRLGLCDGEQYAHERWEPADRPSQEQMLRWLGIDCKDSEDDEGNPSVYIHAQHIEREEI